jgi:hypothetical protein
MFHHREAVGDQLWHCHQFNGATLVTCFGDESKTAVKYYGRIGRFAMLSVKYVQKFRSNLLPSI